MDANGGGGDDDDARAPLLAGGPGRRNNSVGSMRGEFVSRLPKKVLDAVDPERPSHVDFSRSKGLREGSALQPSSPSRLLPPVLDKIFSFPFFFSDLNLAFSWRFGRCNLSAGWNFCGFPCFSLVVVNW
jgi:hypothetical protein